MTLIILNLLLMAFFLLSSQRTAVLASQTVKVGAGKYGG